MDYDKNGNIQSLKRNGDFDSNIYGFMEIDDLVYDYDDNLKNQLVNVTDNTNDPKGFKDENNGTADYAYDANGNMIKDENKFISSIVYNHLNLPTQINFATGDKIEYLYDAIGQKKSKKVTQADTETLTDYLDGYQYTNEVLNFFPHAEGYVNMSYCRRCDEQGSKFEFNYVYNYTDHLGNIRVSYSVDKIDRVLKILEENHYYPFGLKHTNYNSGNKKYYEEDIVLPLGMVATAEPAVLEAFGKKIIQTLPSDGVMYKYKYNGKELQDELGLNMYDYGARNYDPALGRWMNIDPKAETSRRFSPYTYCLNNPVFFIDPDGMQANLPDDNDDIITKVSNTRGDKHYKQRDVNMTMTLTIVNENGADLSKTMFNKSSGTVALSSLSGNAQTDNRALDITTSDNLNVSVSYKVVSSLNDIGKDDHVMVIAENIPRLKTGDKVDPVGLSETGGRVSAVEKGTIVNKTFNEAATHEIGHLLGLGHRNGGLMNASLSGSMGTSQRERGEIIGGGEGQISPTTGNGTYRQSNGHNDYKTSIKSQVNSFLSNNNITK